MKNINQVLPYTLSIGFVISILFLTGCKSSSDPQPDLLTKKTWTVSTVTVDGVDKTSLFANMTLNFSDKTFATTKGGGAWPASDAWSYASGSSTVIVRGDGTQLTIEELTQTKLKLSFNWAKTTFGGRTSSVGGQNVFTFN